MRSPISGRPAKIIYTLMALVLIAIMAQANRSGSALRQKGATSGAGPQLLAPAGAGLVRTGSGAFAAPVGVSGHPIVGRDVKHDLSPPLRDIKPLPPVKGKQEAPENPAIGKGKQGQGFAGAGKDPVVQDSFGPLAMP